MNPYALAALQLIAVVAGYAAVAVAFVAFVRWLDRVESAESFALHGPDGVVVIGLHNGAIAALPDADSHEAWRRVHDRVTNAPGYLFDKSKRDCWAVLIRPGQSNDVFFVGYGDAWAERAEATK